MKAAAPSSAAGSLRDHAAQMLMRASPIAELDFAEACAVIDAMEPVFVRRGTVFIEEGQVDERDGNEFMALLIEGQVRAESATGTAGEELLISLIDPGSLIGEMGLFDGAPRSATCTALTDLKLAVLSRAALRGLVEAQPRIAARLLLAIAGLLGDRVRESTRRRQMLAQLHRAMQRELDATHAANRRLLAAGEREASLLPHLDSGLDSGFGPETRV